MQKNNDIYTVDRIEEGKVIAIHHDTGEIAIFEETKLNDKLYEGDKFYLENNQNCDDIHKVIQIDNSEEKQKVKNLFERLRLK